MTQTTLSKETVNLLKQGVLLPDGHAIGMTRDVAQELWQSLVQQDGEPQTTKKKPTPAQIACAEVCAAFDLLPSFAAKEKAMEIIEKAIDDASAEGYMKGVEHERKQ